MNFIYKYKFICKFNLICILLHIIHTNSINGKFLILLLISILFLILILLLLSLFNIIIANKKYYYY